MAVNRYMLMVLHGYRHHINGAKNTGVIAVARLSCVKYRPYFICETKEHTYSIATHK